MRQKAARLGYTPYQVVTMASIVERETAVQRRLVASVYYNRLRDNMLLQADPTVQYAKGRHGNWWPVITQADERNIKSKFNTYAHLGLPPGPIANPGLGSLQAALNPAHTNYLYFVTKCGTPYSVFAKTLGSAECQYCQVWVPLTGAAAMVCDPRDESEMRRSRSRSRGRKHSGSSNQGLTS